MCDKTCSKCQPPKPQAFELHGGWTSAKVGKCFDGVLFPNGTLVVVNLTPSMFKGSTAVFTGKTKDDVKEIYSNWEIVWL